MSDVVQYMVSKTIGKRKIIPKVTSTITLEGMVISTIVTVIVAMIIAPRLTPLPMLFGLFSGLLIAVAGLVGTMNVSYVKKDLQLDGNGEMIPHKESFLSRIDSLSYTAPLFLHFLRYFFEWM
jgi:phosphatidate cytidylyltransferase